MSRDAQLSCRCGAVVGSVQDAGAQTANRVVCHCDDCQAFLHHLGRADLLDEHGGTDIVQVAPASLSFHRGTEHIAGLRLTANTLYRWYATCCHTPLGNTVGPAIPFVGVVAQVVDAPDDAFGAPIGSIFGRFAIGTPPAGSTGWNLRLYARAIWMVLGWRLGGKAFPHPFFDRDTGRPKYPVSTLSPSEREALRPLCGPRPTTAT
jgi:hypothetical protein